MSFRSAQDISLCIVEPDQVSASQKALSAVCEARPIRASVLGGEKAGVPGIVETEVNVASA